MMEDVFSRDTFQSHKKYCRFGKKNFNGLYFKKLILNLPYNYQKYPAPNALIYSNMSVVVVEGFGSLPD